MTTPRESVLVVIIGETVLQDTIVKLLQSLGIKGYTLSQAQGAGRHGNRQGDMVGYNTNIEIKTIVSTATATTIFTELEPYQENHALIVFSQSVQALAGFEIV